MAEQTSIHALAPKDQTRPVTLSILRLLNLSTAIGIAGGLITINAWRVGIMAVPLGTSVIGTLCFGALIMVSGGLALSDSTKSLRRYLEENTAVWLGFGFGGVLVGGLIAKFGTVLSNPEGVIMHALATSVIGFAVTTLGGSTLLAIRRASGVSSNLSDSSMTSGPGSPPSLLNRATGTVRRWLIKVWHDQCTTEAVQVCRWLFNQTRYERSNFGMQLTSRQGSRSGAGSNS